MGLRQYLQSKSNQQGDPISKAVKQITGLKPKNLSVYQTAFTHKSMGITLPDGHPMSYERLEFLGDAILGSIIAEFIYHEVPSADEGYLTKMRSKIVSRAHLNELGQDLRLLKHARTQVPEQHFGPNVHGNLFEALVGAVYLDRGYNACKSFIQKKMIDPYVDIQKLEGKITSYKSLLIEWCQKNRKRFDYETYQDDSAENERFFAVKLRIDNRIISKARATSKKKAEEKASKRAFYALQDKIQK
jgi:ribonuclease-3